MRNLAANFGKILDICKNFSKNLVDERGNMPRRGVVPRFSDLEVIALSLTAEKCSVDSESYLFSLLEEYKSDIPNLISRRQFNDRRKFTATYVNKYERTLLSRLMQAKICFVLILNQYPYVVLLVQSVVN